MNLSADEHGVATAFEGPDGLALAEDAHALATQLQDSQPDAPATVELTDGEIEALIMMKRSRKKKNELVPDDVPSIAQAVRWIADLGGYVGSKSSGPPGATVIARGLERVRMWEDLLVVARESGKLR